MGSARNWRTPRVSTRPPLSACWRRWKPKAWWRDTVSGGYRLGVELVALGGCAVRSNPLRAVSRPLLETLAQECDEAATLEVLIGPNVLIVDEVASGHLMGMTQDVGARLPADLRHRYRQGTAGASAG